ncbi:helix-turn-helix domain-containing protein [Nonomuraea sp. NPDC050536]|uniref:helix-turn-helix domain-containing protein n=1 Tax=Nonomuraea sp. NPDC050536 TaxID=3364366 RepID=UPI0037C7191B
MQLRYNFRLYPTPGQQVALARAFGCARTVFNDALRARQEAREQGLPYVSDGELSKRVITRAKVSTERCWLGEVSAVVLQQALADLNIAYRNFFASVTGRRKGVNVRSWTCPGGVSHDRDVNAAINILAAGRAESLNACGGTVRPSLAVARPDEAGTRSKLPATSAA